VHSPISLALREQVCFLSARCRITVIAMYQPDHHRVEDVAQMHALMRAKPFAALISCGSSGLYATHLPTVLKDEGAYGVIECHLARANPHWKDLAEGNEALMIFQGAEGYITPNWYPSKTLHGKVVPTWNYAVVHAYGRPELAPPPRERAHRSAGAKRTATVDGHGCARELHRCDVARHRGDLPWSSIKLINCSKNCLVAARATKQAMLVMLPNSC
jgi:hypothetical protein